MIARQRLRRSRADLVVVHCVTISGQRPVPTDVTTPQLRPPLVIAAFVSLSRSRSNGDERSPNREYVVVVIPRRRLRRSRADLVVVHCVTIPGRRTVPTDFTTPLPRLPLVIAAFVALSSSHSNGSERSPSRERVVVEIAHRQCCRARADLLVVHGVAISGRRPVPTDVITSHCQLRLPLVIAAFVSLSSSRSNGDERSPSREYVVVVIPRRRLRRSRADLVVVHCVTIPGRRTVPTDFTTPLPRLPLVIAAFVALSSSHSNGSERSPSRERVVVEIAHRQCCRARADLLVVHGVAISGRRPVPTDVITSHCQLRLPLVIAAFVSLSSSRSNGDERSPSRE